MDVNVTGLFLCAREAARWMIEQQDRRCDRQHRVDHGPVGRRHLSEHRRTRPSKGAVVNLTRALAIEWAPHGIRVNAVAPTWVRTDLTQGLFNDPALLGRVLDMTPLRRLAEPADVADAIVFLASDRAAMITGHTLPVDGGFLAQ